MGSALDYLTLHRTPGSSASPTTDADHNRPPDRRPGSRASLLHDAPGLVFLLIAIADCGRVADTDLWGHLRFGQLMLFHGPYPGPDPYSYAPHLKAWLHHEWLSEVLMAWLYGVAGVVALKLWKFACSAATICLIATAEGETGAATGVQLAVLGVIAFGLIPYLQFRPLLFSYAFTALIVAALARENYRDKPLPWLIILLFPLWANLHGSFFVGLGVLGIYTIARGIVDFAARRGIRRMLRCGAVTLASTLATLVTPYGLDTWRAVAISIENPMTRHVMADWRPLLVVLGETFHQTPGGAGFLLIPVAVAAVLALSLLLAPRGNALALVAMAGALNVSAFMAIRNAPLALIASAPPLTHHLGLAIRRLLPREDGFSLVQSESAPALSGPFQLLTGLLGALLLLSGGLFSSELPAAAHYPEGAVTYMDSHRLGGNILNYFAWGQYLIWHEASRSKVFIDGRYDLVYPPAIVRQYLDFYEHPEKSTLLDRYPHDYVLMPTNSAVAHALQRREHWRLLYRDDVAVLYGRTAAADALPVIERSAPTKPSYFP